MIKPAWHPASGSASIRWVLACVAAVLAALPCKAAPTADVRLQKTVVGVGETTALEIVVTGTAEATVTATLPAVSGLRVSGPQTSRMSQTTIINGRQESSITTTLSYQVTALHSGQFTIPAFEVQVDGAKTTVGPLRLRAEESPQSAAIRLRTTIDDRSPFVQQPLTYRVTWSVADEIHGYDLTIPALDERHDYLVHVLTPSSARTQDLVIHKATHKAAVGKETLDGADYTTFTITARIYPLREGSIVLPAPLVRAAVQQGWEVVRDFFFAERRPKLVTMTAVGEQFTLAVRALPSEGRPRGFGGAVGRYSFLVSASDTVARVGDPIRLTMKVRGSGLLSQVPRPELGALAEVTKDFTVLGTLEPGEVSGDQVVFEEIVRPKTADVKQFPSIPLAYFDPSKEEYHTAWSDPIPLRVMAAPDVGPVEAFGARDASARTPSEAAGGLRAPYRGPRLTDTPGDPWSPLIYLLAAPVAYGVLFAGMTVRRRVLRDAAGWSRRSAVFGFDKDLARLKKTARQEGDAFYADLADLCARQAAARLGVSSAEITPHDVPRLVGDGTLSQESGARLEGLLEEIDHARFSPHSTEAAARLAILERARTVLKGVKRP
ncbi:BatD family protein [Candidatus Fermentibacteria bacterium]|nr:BatD family protein [Candidatus Fermentibacteria bacterium]